MNLRRKTPVSDRDRSRNRHDLLVVLGAVVLCTVGVTTGVFEAIHGSFEGRARGLANSALGILLVASGAGGVIMLLQRRRGRDDRSRQAETEAKYQAMIEQVPAVAYAWDPANEPGSAAAAYISPQIERLLGFTAEQWLDDPELWARQVHPDDIHDVLSAWSEAVEAQSGFAADYRIRSAQGGEVWVRDEATPVIDGGIVRYRGVIHDITPERETQQALRSAEERYRSLVEQMPAVTYRSDVTDRIEGDRIDYISPRVLDLTGFTPEEWSSPGFWESRIHEADRSQVVAEARITDGTGEPFDAEYRLVRKDGSTIWVHDTSAVVHREDDAAVWQGLIQDVTERKDAERALALAEDRFRTLVEQLPVVIYIDAIDEIATARYVSPQYERLTGYTPAERLADPGLWMRIVHPDDQERVITESNRTNETGEDYDIDHRIVRKDGRTVWVRDHGVLVRSADGENAWQGVLTDITDRKLAEEAISSRDGILEAAGYTAERFLRAGSWRDHIDEVLARLGEAGRATRVGVFENVDDTGDERHVRMQHAWLASDAPAALGRSPSITSRGGDLGSWEAVLDGGGVIHGPTNALPDAERRLFEELGIRSVIVMPVFVDGTWWGSIGLDECRTDRVWQAAEIGAIRVVANTLGAAIERELSARKLTEAEERYRAIVEHVPATIYLDRADASMRSIYVSPQIEEMTGITSQEWIAQPDLWLKIMAPEDRADVQSSYLDAITARRPWKAEYRWNTRDGRTIWVHDEITFVTDADGEPLFLQGVLMDITERKLAEQALRESERHEREAAARLRALDDMKNTFLAAVSHELRSPLTSILGLSITLERAPDMPMDDRGDLLERLAFNARKLDRLLKDLLDIDRLNRGIVEPQYRTVDVAALTRRSVESLDALDERLVEVDAQPLVLTVDPPKLERIIENLVTNAARHTQATNRIWVKLEPSEGGALLSVEDDGPGVPAELRDAIFEPFRQGPTASPHSPGTGVGLSLVAKFAELHGGRAWVEDRPGGGAAFRVFLPSAPGTGTDATDLGATDLGATDDAAFAPASADVV